MKRNLFLASTAFALIASLASAQSIQDQVVSQLQAQNYSRIEVKTGLTQIKVEAIRDGQKLEIIYDAATGAILKQEISPVDGDDDTAPGLEVRNEGRDFLDDDDSDDGSDDDGEDDNRGHGNDDDRDDDDNPGRGHGGDDDEDDNDDDEDEDDNDDDSDDDEGDDDN